MKIIDIYSGLYSWQYAARQMIMGEYYRLTQRHDAFDPTLQRRISSPERVLLVLCGLIGDSVMCTPVIVEARRLWSRAEITLLGYEHNCELLSGCSFIDAFMKAPADPFSLRKRRGIAQLKQWMKNKRFDIAIILLGDNFAPMLSSAGIPIRVGVRGHTLAPCLSHLYDIGRPQAWGPGERLNSLRCLGIEVTDSTPRLWISEEARSQARRRLAGLGVPSHQQYVVVHPFGRTPRQRWPLDRTAEIAEYFRRHYDMCTVVVGGPETKGQITQIGNQNMIDVTGAFSLPHFLAIIEDASLVVTTDSGPFHVAGAIGRPLVGLFRASRPEHATRYSQAKVLLGRDESCNRHCTWDHCRTLPCRQLDKISSKDVVDAAEKMHIGGGSVR